MKPLPALCGGPVPQAMPVGLAAVSLRDRTELLRAHGRQEQAPAFSQEASGSTHELATSREGKK